MKGWCSIHGQTRGFDSRETFGIVELWCKRMRIHNLIYMYIYSSPATCRLILKSRARYTATLAPIPTGERTDGKAGHDSWGNLKLEYYVTNLKWSFLAMLSDDTVHRDTHPHTMIKILTFYNQLLIAPLSFPRPYLKLLTRGGGWPNRMTVASYKSLVRLFVDAGKLFQREYSLLKNPGSDAIGRTKQYPYCVFIKYRGNTAPRVFLQMAHAFAMCISTLACEEDVPNYHREARV